MEFRFMMQLWHTSLRIRKTFEEHKNVKNEELLNKPKPRTSSTSWSSIHFDSRNKLIEALKLKLILKRRIKGIMRL